MGLFLGVTSFGYLGIVYSIIIGFMNFENINLLYL